MVITITLNPAMDKTVVLKGLKVGEVNRLISSRTDLGGKGINVSKVLNEFQVPSIAMGFLGGILEEAFRQELKTLDITDRFITIEGESRTNIKIVDEDNQIFTELNEKGPMISKEENALFLEIFRELIHEEDLVVISGGLCPGVPKDFYGTLTAMARQKGAYVIVDAEGEALKYAIKQKPNVIKPNEKEFAELFGESELSLDDMIEKAQELIKEGLDKVLISRGEKGSLFITKEGVLTAKALKVQVKSTVGAGDSMVSALVYSYIHNLSALDTFAMTQATAAASVMMEGTKACTMKDVREKLHQVRELINELKP